ncbi:MAG TPA: ABC transporter ATP-binding protein [Sphingobacteriaceae bacterium]|nr:ABC transporter ATP-binding protein [Sphingobacteriaceae bacterium]
MPPIITLEGVSKRFHPGPVQALDRISLTVEQGEILTLLGPSGCGKTTTLRLIAGFERPDPNGGVIRIQGRTVAGPSTWVPPERRGIGMVFQDYALFPHLTVLENVMFGLNGRRDRVQRAKEVLDMVGLTNYDHRFPHELSGGQQQRVALARALAPEPVVLLLDEPFSNLDTHLRHEVRDEVVSILRSAGITCVFVTHDQKDALAISDRIAVLNQGRLEQVGTPREIYKSPATIFVATFVGRSNLLEGTIHGSNGCVLTDFGSLCRVERSGLPEGTPVLVAVRPDGFQPAGDGPLRGCVVSTTYAGNNIEAVIEMTTLHGRPRRVVAHLSPGTPVAVGQQVAFRLEPEFVSVVRNACEMFQEAAG